MRGRAKTSDEMGFWELFTYQVPFRRFGPTAIGVAGGVFLLLLALLSFPNEPNAVKLGAVPEWLIWAGTLLTALLILIGLTLGSVQEVRNWLRANEEANRLKAALESLESTWKTQHAGIERDVMQLKVSAEAKEQAAANAKLDSIVDGLKGIEDLLAQKGRDASLEARLASLEASLQSPRPAPWRRASRSS